MNFVQALLLRRSDLSPGAAGVEIVVVAARVVEIDRNACETASIAITARSSRSGEPVRAGKGEEAGRVRC